MARTVVEEVSDLDPIRRISPADLGMAIFRSRDGSKKETERLVRRAIPILTAPNVIFSQKHILVRACRAVIGKCSASLQSEILPLLLDFERSEKDHADLLEALTAASQISSGLRFYSTKYAPPREACRDLVQQLAEAIENGSIRNDIRLAALLHGLRFARAVEQADLVELLEKAGVSGGIDLANRADID